jgi:hypothetical protein
MHPLKTITADAREPVSLLRASAKANSTAQKNGAPVISA